MRQAESFQSRNHSTGETVVPLSRNNGLVVGIDASNLRRGGGVTHLVEFLRAADTIGHNFSLSIVWGGKETLSQIEERPCLVKRHEKCLDRGLPFRLGWQRHNLGREARAAGCNVLFVPGGTYAGDFLPFVAMCRNMLPFEWTELRRYGWSWICLRLLMLRAAQTRTFSRAEGLIFLTPYARNAVRRIVKGNFRRTVIIPHGVNNNFKAEPKKQTPIEKYSTRHPFRILYVSIIDVYKHQWHVAEAVATLRKAGLPVELHLVGPSYGPALKRLKGTMERLDRTGVFLHYEGAVPYQNLPSRYAQADLCLFASSCENMPNILLEGMASGLPIACSNRGPMPEILGNAGVYFDPENPADIACALRKLIGSPELRSKLAADAFERARQYSWERCAGETFAFLAEVADSARPTNREDVL